MLAHGTHGFSFASVSHERYMVAWPTYGMCSGHWELADPEEMQTVLPVRQTENGKVIVWSCLVFLALPCLALPCLHLLPAPSPSAFGAAAIVRAALSFWG